MNVLTLIPWGSLKAAGRYALATLGGALTTAAALGLISQHDAAAATQALTDLAVAVGSLAASVGALTGILVSLYAGIRGAMNATPDAHRASVAALGDIVITDAATAKAIPSKNVVSSLQEAAQLPGVEPTIESANAAAVTRGVTGL